MADDENEQTTPHWGTSAPDYEGEDPENEIELDPNMAELPLFAGLEAKKIFADIEKQREKLEKAQADYADHEERYKVMVEHLKNVRQEVQHTEGLASAKRAEVASEDHLAQMAKREAGRYRQELKREQQELEAIDSTLNALQNQVFGANEKMDGFKLQMNWNQEELEQWALASKQKEEDNLAIEKYTRADEAKINQLALQIEKLTKRDLEIQAQVEAEATETSSRQIELDRTAEEFRVLHAERQKLVQQWKETIEVAARRDQDITKTATEYVQQKQAKEVVDVDLKAAREDLDKVQALHTELQTEVTARERQLQARREFLLSEQERKKKLEEEIAAEYSRQREYLEKSVESLKRKLNKNMELHRSDNMRMMSENVALIKEINELRREIKGMKMAQRAKELGAFFSDHKHGYMLAIMIAKLEEYLEIFEARDFHDVAISAKSMDARLVIDAYTEISRRFDYPLHLGVTHAGTRETGSIRSIAALGTLLANGIDRFHFYTMNKPELCVAICRILRALPKPMSAPA